MSNRIVVEPWSQEKLEVTQVYEVVESIDCDGHPIRMTLVNDLLQSIDDKSAYKKYFLDSDKVFMEVWCDQGLADRKNDWAVIFYFENGNVNRRDRFKAGKSHRYGFDTSCEFYDEDTGNLEFSVCHENGVGFHSFSPMSMSFDPISEVMIQESWNTLLGFDGTHRDDGEAAFIMRNSVTGFPELKLWVQQGQLFRENGKPPVEIWDGHTNTLIETAFEHKIFPKKDNIPLSISPD